MVGGGQGSGVGNSCLLASWSEAQVTNCTWDWHLDWGRVVTGLWDRALWDLILFPGRWCQNWAELSDIQLVLEKCVVVWEEYPQVRIKSASYCGYVFACYIGSTDLDGLHACVLSHFSCVWILGNPMGSSVHGILQARREWVAMPSFRGIFLTKGSNQQLLSLLNWQAGSLPPAPSGNELQFGNNALKNDSRLNPKKEQNWVIHQDVDGRRDCYTEWNK